MPFAVAILLVAAIWNWRTGVVPNVLSLLLLFLFIPFAWATQLPLNEIGFRLALCVASLVVSFPLFHLGHIAGGTVKLVAATIVWLPWHVGVAYLLFCLAIGICMDYAEDMTEVRIIDWISEQHATIAACLGILLVVATH